MDILKTYRSEMPEMLEPKDDCLAMRSGNEEIIDIVRDALVLKDMCI